MKVVRTWFFGLAFLCAVAFLGSKTAETYHGTSDVPLPLFQKETTDRSNAPVLISEYMVKKGDKLSSIAVANGTTVAEIKAINDLTSNLIRQGQTLMLPRSTSVNDGWLHDAGYIKGPEPKHMASLPDGGQVTIRYDLPFQGKTTCIYADNDTIWIGTGNGLFLLNPTTGASTFLNSGNTILPANWITGIAKGGDGKIWIGTVGGLASYDRGNWHAWDDYGWLVDEGSTAMVNSLKADAEGRIWVCFRERMVGFSSLGLKEITGICIISPDGEERQFFKKEIQAIGDVNGVMLVSETNWGDNTGANESIFLYDDSKQYAKISLELGGKLLSYAMDKSGNLLAYEESITGLYWQHELDYVREISGALFVYKDFDAQKGYVQASRTEFPGKKVDYVFNDSFGNIFAVAAGRAYVWKEEAWSVLPLSAELLEGEPFLAGTQDGRVLLSNKGKLTVISDGKQKTLVYNNSPFNNIHYWTSPEWEEHESAICLSREVVVDGNGRLWFTADMSLICYDGSAWKIIPLEEDPSGLCIDSEFNIWLCVADKLYQVRDDALSFIRVTADFMKMVMDSQDRLWVLTVTDVLMHQNGTWSRYEHRKCGLTNLRNPTEETYSSAYLHVDVQDRLWLISYDDIYLFDNEQWQKQEYNLGNLLDNDDWYDSEQGGLNPWVDNTGRFWFSPMDAQNTYSYHNGKATVHPALPFYGSWDFYVAGPGPSWRMWGMATKAGPCVELMYDGQNFVYCDNNPLDREGVIGIDNNGNLWYHTERGAAAYNESGIDLWNVRASQ